LTTDSKTARSAIDAVLKTLDKQIALLLDQQIRKLIDADDDGKVAKLVIVACMRKLLTLINAMIRDNLMWHDELHAVRTLDT
jgi:hypothetical protein